MFKVFVLILSALSLIAPPSLAQNKPQTEELQALEKAGGKIIYLGKTKDVDNWLIVNKAGEPLTILGVTPEGAIIRLPMPKKLLIPAKTEATTPAVGTKAPAFALKDQNGKEVTLDSLKDKGLWYVIYFYPKDFTEGCSIEAHNFQRDLAKYKEEKTAIIGISVDSPDSHKKFCDEQKLEFTLLSDEGGSVSKAYGSAMEREGIVLSARNTFIIDEFGMVQKTYTGVSPATHSEEVLKDLAQLKREE